MENQSNSPSGAIVQQPQNESVRSLLAKEGYQARFKEILGARAAQFCASIVQAANSYQLRSCEPKSVIAAAVVAASLDLPIDRNLGFSHIVPYKGKASFQMGYKGFIQLALRSGQFLSMRDAKINAEAFLGYDDITGDPKIDWTKLDESQDPIGYAFAWRLINGFSKIVFWKKEDVLKHAERFSQAFRASDKKSPWATDFDSMALKTVIKSALAKWAPLSTQMAQAVAHDEGSQKDVDAEIDYIDNEPEGVENEPRKPIFGKKEASAPTGAPQEPQAADDPAARKKLISDMQTTMFDCDVSESRLWKYAKDGKHVPEGVDELFALPTAVLAKLAIAIPTLGKKKTETA